MPYSEPKSTSSIVAEGAEALRSHVLRSLEAAEPRTVPEIPRSWPTLRSHIAGVVRMLRGEGLLERVADVRTAGTAPAYRLTPAGRRALARMRA